MGNEFCMIKLVAKGVSSWRVYIVLSCEDTECLDGTEDKIVHKRLGRDQWNQATS